MSGSISQSTSLNRYAYANGNPISYIDPFGLSAEVGINWIQTNEHEILDVLGMLPSVGIIFDTANLLWYLEEGDWVNAAFSGMALLPVIGEAAGAGKVVGTSVKVVENQALEVVAKYGDDVVKVADDIIQAAKSPVGQMVLDVTENVTVQEFSNIIQDTSSNNKTIKTLSEWLSDFPELLDEVTRWYQDKPEWWGIDPNSTDVFYRTTEEVQAIRKKAGESGGHHPHGLALGDQKGRY